jgi:hypothetical protein
MDVFLYILSAICLLMLATILRHLLTVRRRLVTRIDVFRCKVRVTTLLDSTVRPLRCGPGFGSAWPLWIPRSTCAGRRQVI